MTHFKTFLGRHPKSMLTLIFMLFMIVSGLTVYFSNSYLSILWNISQCDWHPPGEKFIMSECDSVITPFYRLGSLYLDVDSRLTSALRNADVVITGNSRTRETFVLQAENNPIEIYFKNKGMKAFIIAEEGSGFRFRKMVLEKLHVTPRIALINTEDLAADMLEDSNKELVFNPDRFKLPFKVIHFSIEMQQRICNSDNNNFFMKHLKNFYCYGTIIPGWRSLSTGIVASIVDRKPKDRRQILMSPDTHLSLMDIYRRRMQIMLKSDSWLNSCILFYEIPNPNQFFEVSTKLANEFKKPFIFPKVSPKKQYFVYDGSHMEEDTALRWTKTFLRKLDPYINACG